jgi:hypothetical protein
MARTLQTTCRKMCAHEIVCNERLQDLAIVPHEIWAGSGPLPKLHGSRLTFLKWTGQLLKIKEYLVDSEAKEYIVYWSSLSVWFLPVVSGRVIPAGATLTPTGPLL